MASELLVFAHTSPFRPGPRFARSVVVPLRRPTLDTARLVQAAVAGIRSIYQPGHDLIKAGVMLLDLVCRSVHQGELALEPCGGQEREHLMTAMDAINHRHGAGTLYLASSGIDDHRRLWGIRQAWLTPGYTTDWMGMPIAKAV